MPSTGMLAVRALPAIATALFVSMVVTDPMIVLLFLFFYRKMGLPTMGRSRAV